MTKISWFLLGIAVVVIIYLAMCNKPKPTVIVDNKYKDTLQQYRDSLEVHRASESVWKETAEAAEVHIVELGDRSDKIEKELRSANKEVTYWANKVQHDTVHTENCDGLVIASKDAQVKCDSTIKIKDETIMWYKGEVGSYKLMTQSMAHDTTLYAGQVKILENQVGKLEKAAQPFRTFSAGAELGSLIRGSGYLKAVLEYNTANGYHIAGSFGYQTTGLKIAGVKVSKDIFKIPKKH